MIPSLSGGLYQFNGENVEVTQWTADELLQSSVFFKDDLVLTGMNLLLIYLAHVLIDYFTRTEKRNKRQSGHIGSTQTDDRRLKYRRKSLLGRSASFSR